MGETGCGRAVVGGIVAQEEQCDPLYGGGGVPVLRLLPQRVQHGDRCVRYEAREVAVGQRVDESGEAASFRHLVIGLMTAEQARGLAAAARQFPRARWIVAQHHHLIEYPTPAKAFSERIGTALINGSWFVRQLQQHLGPRAVVMHGHRHIDWIGECGSLRIISAPSPVMEASDYEATSFYIHVLAAGPHGRLCLLPPERVHIAGEDDGVGPSSPPTAACRSPRATEQIA